MNTALLSSWCPRAHIKGAQASAHIAVYPAARSKAGPAGTRAARKANGSVRELPKAHAAVTSCLDPASKLLCHVMEAPAVCSATSDKASRVRRC